MVGFGWRLLLEGVPSPTPLLEDLKRIPQFPKVTEIGPSEVRATNKVTFLSSLIFTICTWQIFEF